MSSLCLVLAFACTFDSVTGGPDDPTPTGTDSAADTSTSDTSSTEDSSSDTTTTTTDTSPPFTCEPSAATGARIGGDLRTHPVDPHPGDTLVVTVRSTDGTSRTEAPDMVLHALDERGSQPRGPQAIEGGAAVYYFAVSDLVSGDVCLEARIGDAVEASGKVTVTPRPPVDTSTGVYKVTTNHQWTCGEQPTYGNEVHIAVLDASGQGVAGAEVEVILPTTTVPPIYNDTEPSSIPARLAMDGSGRFVGYNSWPSHDNGLMVFELSVADAPSDIATEITTGWWEDDLAGCNYCNTYGINVWGHWSHTIVFQRDASATQACLVPTDHGGMSACGEPRHIHHDPDHPACWDVNP